MKLCMADDEICSGSPQQNRENACLMAGENGWIMCEIFMIIYSIAALILATLLILLWHVRSKQSAQTIANLQHEDSILENAAKQGKEEDDDSSDEEDLNKVGVNIEE